MKYLWTEDTGAGLHFWKLVNQLFFDDTLVVESKESKCIPDIENYEYVPVNNSMLAKAEIPFLIFERNRGKCFIEMY